MGFSPGFRLRSRGVVWLVMAELVEVERIVEVREGCPGGEDLFDLQVGVSGPEEVEDYGRED